MSSSMPSGPSSCQKRVGRQRQQANSKFGSWFVSKFVTKTKMLREHDEETAQTLRRRPIGTLSAVTNQQQRASRSEEKAHSKPIRQKSFLRQQLQEMKRQSAEALHRVQKRMDGECVEEEDKSWTSSDDEEDLHVVDDTETVKVSSRRRSAAEVQQEREDEIMAHEVQRDEYSEEVNRRMSQATQLYAEAINTLDFALHPGRQPDIEPSPMPLFLGVKKDSPNRPKSEWI